MKIAIIGAGIVGSTLAYYLHQNQIEDVTIYDHGQGQATKAAAGIICPWFSKRRNKAWYQLASKGADFYQKLVADMQEEGQSTDFYQQNGVYLLKKNDSKLEELLEIAQARLESSPIIGELRILEKAQALEIFPGLEGFERVLFASGAARVDGAALCQSLLDATPYPILEEKVSLELSEDKYQIKGQNYDQVFLTSGAWLGQILEPLGYQVDIRPQKGQLLDYQLQDLTTDQLPVVMPEGEIDLIPFFAGKLSIGASHENDKGFDLTADERVLKTLTESAQTYYPALAESKPSSLRIGTRAYTSDFSPFYGQVPGQRGLYAASGLGSSGLTVGPLIAFELVNLFLGRETILNASDYPIENYVSQGRK